MKIRTLAVSFLCLVGLLYAAFVIQRFSADSPDEQVNVVGPAMEASQLQSPGFLTASYPELLWIDLLPLEDYVALFEAPELDHSFGEEDGPSTLLRNPGQSSLTGRRSRFEEALVSTKVVSELDGNKVKLPGFVVPLAYDSQGRVTEFFLVPYFGACIHSPPPPPNQIVYVSYPAGLQLPSIYDPFHIFGTLETTLVENDMAIAAYTIKADYIVYYGELDED
jgi:uncharacterized protein